MRLLSLCCGAQLSCFMQKRKWRTTCCKCGKDCETKPGRDNSENEKAAEAMFPS